MNTELTVPLLFFRDHAKRGCIEHSGTPDEYVVKQNSKQITVRLHDDDISDLMSDAEYYGSKYGFDRETVRSVCGSATSTVKALVRQGVSRQHPHWRVF